MLCPQLSFIPVHESEREMSYFPIGRLSRIIPIKEIWDKWNPRIYSGQNTCSHIQSPNMSQSLARLPIFFAWKIPTLWDSAQVSSQTTTMY